MPVPSCQKSGVEHRQLGAVQNGDLVNANVPKGHAEPWSVSTEGRFPRAARLLKHSDFERVYKQGRRHFSSHMTVFYLRQAEGGTRIGFTVGRVLGGAVVRNRIRRRLREVVRLRRVQLKGPVDVVINPKKSVLTAPFETLREEVARAFAVISGKAGQ